MPREFKNNTVGNYEEACKTPSVFYAASNDNWCSSTVTWNAVLKNFYDPSPAGWRIPSRINFKPLFNGSSWEAKLAKNIRYAPRGVTENVDAYLDAGCSKGYKLRYDNDESHYSYFWLAGYNEKVGQYSYIGYCGWCITREDQTAFAFGHEMRSGGYGYLFFVATSGWLPRDAHTTRCIQEME